MCNSGRVLLHPPPPHLMDTHNSDKKMNMLDPFALLGVTVDSTPKEVRQAYYALSMLTHPDKGGSASDMNVVHHAYKYVIEQVTAVNRTVTVDDLATAFSDFCRVQTEEPPPRFTDILECDMMRQEFNLKFEDVRDNASSLDGWGGASIAGGYGGHMLPNGVEHDDSDSKETERLRMADAAIVEYIEPKTLMDPMVVPIAGVQSLDDYSGPGMADYRAAFSTPALRDTHTSLRVEVIIDERGEVV